MLLNVLNSPNTAKSAKPELYIKKQNNLSLDY
jgi:hypothetical protein